MAPAIVVSHLGKSYQVEEKRVGLLGSLQGLFNRQYKHVQAVDDVSFIIEAGELVGFIGPNGAGKTTTLKMLSGLLYPTQGSARVIGHDPWDRAPEFLSEISLVMGQKNQLWWDLPALESFNLAKDIYNINSAKYKKRLAELVGLLELESVLSVQVRKLSLGQRMKAELALALIHEPRVLFLDEPTIGLDVLMQATVRQFIKTYNTTHNGAIILTSHYMADVKELCKRVIIIDAGHILYDGPLSDIITKFSDHKLIELTLTSGEVKSYRVKRAAVATQTSKLLTSLPVADLNIKEPDIEEVIRAVFDHRA